MFKLSKKADYGLIAMKRLANHRDQHACSANEIAEEYGISATLMAKVLQKLAKNALVGAKHGSTGGYQLAKDPGRISALDVITAIDGPVLITSCVTSHGTCDATDRCWVKEPLRRVNESSHGSIADRDRCAIERGHAAGARAGGIERHGWFGAVAPGRRCGVDRRKGIWPLSCRFTWTITLPPRSTPGCWKRCFRISRKNLVTPPAATIRLVRQAKRRWKPRVSRSLR